MKTKKIKAWAVVGNDGEIMQFGYIRGRGGSLSIFPTKATADLMQSGVQSWGVVPVLITPLIKRKKKT